MRFLSWLLGKKVEAGEPLASASADGVAASDRPINPAPDEDKQAPVNPEADNLRRWRDSGQARAWVESRQGRWNHADWLALLEALKASAFWPMSPDAVGLTLEEVKQQCELRN